MRGKYLKQERTVQAARPIEAAQLKKPLNLGKWLPLLLQVLNLALFFYIIPEDVAENNSIFFALFGSITTVVLSFWIVIALIPKVLEEAPIFTGLACISTLFIFGILFITKTVYYSSQQLRDFGLITKAIVIDKTRIYGKPPNTAEFMVVHFMTENNKSQKATIDLSKSEYNKYKHGDKLYIRYSTEHPNIARIAYGRN